jgi:ribonuclease BN (tRNA processing enzyme)
MTAKKNNRALFRIKFWGVRGSYPTSDASTLAYGGHTSCVSVEVGGQFLIFDAGTGIIPLGKKLVKSRPRAKTLNLFLSHTHHDHIFGFYFFEPLFNSGARIAIFGPRIAGKSVKETLHAAMAPRFFPVGPHQFTAETHFYSLSGNEAVSLRGGGALPAVRRRFVVAAVNDVEVRVHRSTAHPNGVLLYRVSHRGKSVVYATDVEQTKTGHPDIIDFVRGTDVLIHDGQFLEKEYSSRKDSRRGWGHSAVERAAQVARQGAVKRLVLIHHDPAHDDRSLKWIEKLSRACFPSTVVAYEGWEMKL